MFVYSIFKKFTNISKDKLNIIIDFYIFIALIITIYRLRNNLELKYLILIGIMIGLLLTLISKNFNI